MKTLTRQPVFILDACAAQRGQMVPRRSGSEWLRLDGAGTSCDLGRHRYRTEQEEPRLVVGYRDESALYKSIFPGTNDLMGVVAALVELGLCPSTDVEETYDTHALLGSLRTGNWYLNVPVEQVLAALAETEPEVIGSMPTKKRGHKVTQDGLTFINR